MTGKELLKKYLDAKDEYTKTLMTALYTIGDDLLPMLERAEKEGKQIALESAIDPEVGPSEPIVILK